MANPLFNELNANQASMPSNIISQFNSFLRNPMQYMVQRGLNIPQQYMNDPKGAVNYLMRNGQMTQEQFDRLNQMAGQMGFKIN